MSPVQILTAVFPNQPPVNALGNETEDTPSGPLLLGGTPESWLQPVPALSLVAIWRSEPADGVYLSFSVSPFL